MIKPKFLTLSSVEEIANTVTHGFGLLLSICGFVFLVVMSILYGGVWHITSSIVYGLSLVVLYGASTFYHGATEPRVKRVLQIVDHCCIYLLIAGTYTPFTLVVLQGTFGQGLFAFVWLFAIICVLLKIFYGNRFMAVSVISYLVMGWIGIFAIQPLFAALGMTAVVLICAGGMAYTLGVVFFAWNRIPHNHAIWHIFVLTGSICHFLAIALYVIPYAAKT